MKSSEKSITFVNKMVEESKLTDWQACDSGCCPH